MRHKEKWSCVPRFMQHHMVGGTYHTIPPHRRPSVPHTALLRLSLFFFCVRKNKEGSQGGPNHTNIFYHLDTHHVVERHMNRHLSLRRTWGIQEEPTEQLPVTIVSSNSSSSLSSNTKTKRKHFLSVTVVAIIVTCVVLSSWPSKTTTTSSSSANKKEFELQEKKSSSSIFASTSNTKRFTPIHEKCTVWMAASSIKGLQGYGVFVTRDLVKGEPILGVPDGISVPIIGYHQRRSEAKEAWISVWDNYWWGSGVADHVSYEAGPDVVDFQVGFGALPNHHCLLAKLGYIYPECKYATENNGKICTVLGRITVLLTSLLFVLAQTMTPW
jgi:hypothetical protein